MFVFIYKTSFIYEFNRLAFYHYPHNPCMVLVVAAAQCSRYHRIPSQHILRHNNQNIQFLGHLHYHYTVRSTYNQLFLHSYSLNRPIILTVSIFTIKPIANPQFKVINALYKSLIVICCMYIFFVIRHII